MTVLRGNTVIQGPAGKLEAILKEPRQPVSNAAIVCHPHPLFGGTMHNKVVYRMAAAFYDREFAVLRFNFRGAGRSEGTHDSGRGEKEDLRAAVDFVSDRFPEVAIWLAGFSFGAGVMLQIACQDQSVRAFVAAGLPVARRDFSAVGRCPKPKLLIQGELDEFGGVEALRRLNESMGESGLVRIIGGADHFFEDHLDELYEAIIEFINRVQTDAAAR